VFHGSWNRTADAAPSRILRFRKDPGQEKPGLAAETVRNRPAFPDVDFEIASPWTHLLPSPFREPRSVVSRGQFIAQHQTSPYQPGPHVPLSNPERCGSFSSAQLFYIAQYKNLSVFFGQPEDGAGQRFAELNSLQRLSRYLPPVGKIAGDVSRSLIENGILLDGIVPIAPIFAPAASELR
jgi:hypothetical protein